MGDKFSGRIAQAVASQLKHRENGTQNLETQIGHVAMLANAYLDQQTPEVLDWPNEPGWWWTLRVGTTVTKHGTPAVVQVKQVNGGEFFCAGFGDMTIDEIGYKWQRVVVPRFSKEPT